ncbi:hypothetical protein [Streptomyces longwoodensis]|uniref:hypothetical protein n=1 Tax=Streptomyces longwoodensis TaxID=68231 RepID=UPI0036F7AF6B
MDTATWTVYAGEAAQAGLVMGGLAMRQRLAPSVGELYRLSAMIQCLVTGALCAMPSWGALVSATLAVLAAWAAVTEPRRHDRHTHLAHLIHADKDPYA